MNLAANFRILAFFGGCTGKGESMVGIARTQRNEHAGPVEKDPRGAGIGPIEVIALRGEQGYAIK